MTKVVYATDAKADLVEIGGYIALDSERQAEAFIEKLREKARQAARMPRIYKTRGDLLPGLRSAGLGKYLILFRIVPNGIEVLHIVHGARDLSRLFEF